MIVDQPLPLTFRYPTTTGEDLPRLARLAFDLSAIHCDVCRNYHVMWPYLRSIGANGLGPEFAWPIQVETCATAAEGRSDVHWLLAGAADSGQLALVAAAMARAGTPFRATVVDRCATPLALCTAHAAARGIDLETLQSDLMEFARPEAFDAVMLHHIHAFFPLEERAAFVRHAASWVAPGGKVFMTASSDDGDTPPPVHPNPAFNKWRAAAVRAAVAKGELDLPEDLDTFLTHMEQMRDPRRKAEGPQDLDQTKGWLVGAGLEILEVVPLPPAQEEVLIRGATRQRIMIVAQKPLP